MKNSVQKEKSRTILIVDQDKKICESLRKILTAAHPEYQVFFAKNSAGTMEVLKDRTPDLIFLDVVMPDNEGFDLCFLLKSDERYKDIPVLIITAVNRLEHKIKVFKMGASDYILKPPHPEETIARVEAHLKLKSFQDRQKELNAELRRTQEALVQSSKLSAAGTLAAGVAHEFNNILQIIGAAGELCAATGDPNDTKQLLSVIGECTSRGGKIVKGLLDFSRKDELQKREPVELAGLLKQNLRLLGRRIKDVGVELSSDVRDVPAFQGYPGQISQVIVNVVKNAIEAMEDRSEKKLRVSLYLCGCRTDSCEHDPTGQRERRTGCAVMEFEDTGAGIPTKIKSKLFEPFATTKGLVGGGRVSTPGTGLGLSISYGIVKRHGGFIEVDSTEGKGSTFRVYLPLEEP